MEHRVTTETAFNSELICVQRMADRNLDEPKDTSIGRSISTSSWFDNSIIRLRIRCMIRMAACLMALQLLGSVKMLVADEHAVDFESDVRSLLIRRCGDCHGPGKQKGGLRLDARSFALKGGDSGPVLKPGNAKRSELIDRITSRDDSIQMPPEGPRLSAKEVAVLRSWIDAGANWPETQYDRDAQRDPRLKHWSFQPISRSTDDVPAGTHPIDYFLQRRLESVDLTLSAPAEPRTLLRRLCFDLHGLPPGPEQIQSFATVDSDAEFSRFVEQLLASPRYGERWAQHWLDVVRYADTHGFEVNTPREKAWPYRDYVIRAFNSDLPYDQFLRQQLVGDALEADAATGFLVASAVLLPGQIGKDDASKRLARQDSLDEIVIGTSSAMLGLSIGCARCHDHKFDPISQRDYYAMQAFFAGVEYGERELPISESETRNDRIVRLAEEIGDLKSEIGRHQRPVFTGRTLLIDEEDRSRVTYLKKENGPGSNPAGTKRGYRSDPGSADRISNISGGRYVWWNNTPGEDVLAYHPGVQGRFRLWISWGVHGSGVHTRDARYLFDLDGDLETRQDQTELARVDQYRFAGVSDGVTEKVPQWSGFLEIGPLDFQTESRILLRGGETGSGVTADVIVLQEESGDPIESKAHRLPRFRRPLRFDRNSERFKPVTARFLRFTVLETVDDNRHEPCLDELEIYSDTQPSHNLALAANGAHATSSGNYSETGKHQLKHVNDGQYGNDRSWISNKHGGGWVQIELPEQTPIDRVEWGRDREGQFQDRLPVRYEIAVSNDARSWLRIAGSDDRLPLNTPYDISIESSRVQGDGAKVDLVSLAKQLEKAQQEYSRLTTPETAYIGRFRTPDETFLLRRGDPEQRVEPVQAAVPTLFGTEALSDKATEQERRSFLAGWISSPENPLVARVMVNRIWQHHFGRGLVETANDFGLNGSRPSHPELLDWLAAEFIESGWSVKHLHRLIIQSQCYRQSARVHQDGIAKDGDNRLLWRFPSRRLEAEAIRDSMLSVSGELNLQMGGRGFSFFKSRGGLNGFPPVTEFTADQMRRMVYSHRVRMEPVPVFGAFDCPDAGQSMPGRSRSTTAIQALNLFNSKFVIDRAGQFAERVIAEAGTDPDAQVRLAYQISLGREPSDPERTACIQTAREHGLLTVCRVLFNCNEFLFLP